MWQCHNGENGGVDVPFARSNKKLGHRWPQLSIKHKGEQVDVPFARSSKKLGHRLPQLSRKQVIYNTNKGCNQYGQLMAIRLPLWSYAIEKVFACVRGVLGAEP